MIKIVKKLAVALVAVVFFSSNYTSAEENKQDPANSLKKYFDSFNQYEQKRISKAKQAYDQAVRKLNEEHNAKTAQQNRKKIEALTKAVEYYKKQLSSHADAFNRPNVLLNLAITLNELSVLSNTTELENSEFSKFEVVSVLSEIESNHPNFSELDKALYLKALTEQELEKNDQAFATWLKLSSVRSKTNYPIYASIAVGDAYFDQDQPSTALKFFEKAKRQRQKQSSKVSDPLETKIEYRIAWAAYRAANLEKVKASAMNLLNPMVPFFTRDMAKNIREDAIELLSSALFESQSISSAQSVLRNKDISKYAPSLGFNLMKKYHGVEQHKETIDLGLKVAEKFPLSAEYPQILVLIASSYEYLKLDARRIDTLEKAALLLPKTSLWRHKITDPDDVRQMEESGRYAAEAVAIWNFEQGTANENTSRLMKAAAMYSLLVEFNPSSSDAVKWNLRQAHSYFYADELDKAEHLYKTAKTNLAVSPDELQIAAYQLVLTRERKWRKAFNQAIEKGEEPGQDTKAEGLLAGYAQATIEFVNRYPKQSRSVDLLLSLAGAYRDQGNTSKANEYWQRVLVSTAGVPKRALAIRGVVYSHINDNNFNEALKSVKRFLALEDWKSLGGNLKNELLMVLSSLVGKETRNLIENGEIKQAANIMVDTASEVKNLPDHDKFMRDGAYNLAIAGDWTKAEKTASDYLKNKRGKFKDDALYLVARAQEYQLKFDDAAKNYFRLAKMHPRHSRAYVSLERAEKLSLTNEDYMLAGESAELLAKRTRDNDQRYLVYMRAADHFIQAGKNGRAFDIADRAEKISKGSVQKLKSELLQARILYTNDQTTEAEEVANKVRSKVNKLKAKVGRKDWADILGQANLIMAEGIQRKFDSYHVDSEDLQATVSEKSVLFERLYERYIEAIGTDSMEHAPKARFLLARSSSEFSAELSTALSKNDSLPYARRQTVKGQATRLSNIATKLHGENLIAQTKNPSAYKNNPWIMKSMVISGQGEKISNQNDTVLPDTIKFDLPSDWRM